MANFLGPPTFAMNLLHSRGGEGLGADSGRPVEKGRKCHDLTCFVMVPGRRKAVGTGMSGGFSRGRHHSSL